MINQVFKNLLFAIGVCLIFSLVPDGTADFVIDDFSTASDPTTDSVSSGASADVATLDTGADTKGGGIADRQITIEAPAGSNSGAIVVNGSSGIAMVTQDTTSQISLTLDYNFTSNTDFNITDSTSSSKIAIDYFFPNGSAAKFDFFELVLGSGANTSHVSATDVSVSQGDFHVEVPLSEFVTQNGSGANFAAITNFQLTTSATSSNNNYDISLIQVIPEPSTYVMMGMILVGIAFYSRKRKKITVAG